MAGLLEGNDYGLIGGVAEGFKEGIRAYQNQKTIQKDYAIQKQKLDLEQQNRDELKRYHDEQTNLGLIKEGYKRTDSGVEYDPESRAAKQTAISESRAEAFQRAMLSKEQAAEYDRILNERKMNMLEGKSQADIDAKNRDLDIKEKGLALKPGKKSGGSQGGKTLSASSASEAGEADFAINALNDVQAIVDSNKSAFGPISGRAGSVLGLIGIGSTAKKANTISADFKTKAQIIGTYLEGGKLAEGDINRYRDMLPQISDDPDVIAYKIQNLQKLINDKKNAKLKALESAGYNVSNFKRSGSITPKGLIGAQKTSPEVGNVEDGFKFIGGDPGNPKSWEKVK